MLTLMFWNVARRTDVIGSIPVELGPAIYRTEGNYVCLPGVHARPERASLGDMLFIFGLRPRVALGVVPNGRAGFSRRAAPYQSVGRFEADDVHRSSNSVRRCCGGTYVGRRTVARGLILT